MCQITTPIIWSQIKTNFPVLWVREQRSSLSVTFQNIQTETNFENFTSQIGPIRNRNRGLLIRSLVQAVEPPRLSIKVTERVDRWKELLNSVQTLPSVFNQILSFDEYFYTSFNYRCGDHGNERG